MNRTFIKKWHFILELVSYGFLLGALLVGIIGQFTLPPEIPTSFDMSGNVTETGSPSFMILFVGIMLVTNAVLTLCLHVVPPNAWNMPKPVKPGNEIAVYGDVSAMCSELEAVMGLFTLLFNLGMYFSLPAIGEVLSIFLVAGIAVIIVLNIVLMTKHNR